MDNHFFSDRNESMLAEIALGAFLMSDQLGHDTFDPRVLDAMRAAPRHEFVPLELQEYAYLVQPLSIGFDKTISNPLIIAAMTDLLQVEEHHTVLEIGTGLGYHAAIVAQMAKRVVSMEIIEQLALQAQARLARTGCDNVEVIVGNGAQGLSSLAPFDRILVTCAPQMIPTALLNQLKPGGRMVIPSGLEGEQMLMLVKKDATARTSIEHILPVGFGPMEGVESVLHS
ncbi:MAG TPA: protein-L-isoaspartate(D-aspartate) O-methyltransferase [Azoarcus sp.]|nr:protein-L-isoaspartate(D-aspartate) O-methyltransferase [Azoarcus sp.]